MNMVSRYFEALFRDFGNGWNRFWFAPTDRLPLDVLRVVVGLISLYMLGTLTPDLGLYFGEGGLLPTSATQQLEGRFVAFSYLNYFDSPSELLTVHIAGIVVVALFTCGIATSITSVLSLLVMVSTVNRAPVLCTLVEPVLTMTLFYLCLGPAGPIAGVARLLSGKPTPAVSSWSTVALRLLQVHLAMIYATMGLSKLMGEAWWSGMGTWWLATRTDSRMIDLTALGSSYPYVINVWSHLIVAFEIAFAVLIWNRLARPLLLAWAIVHWIGIALLLGQLPLAATMIGVNVAYLSAEFLRDLLATFGLKRTAAIATN